MKTRHPLPILLALALAIGAALGAVCPPATAHELAGGALEAIVGAVATWPVAWALGGLVAR